jgi:uncharacterized protein
VNRRGVPRPRSESQPARSVRRPLWHRLADRWIGRAARPLPEALAACVALRPAVVVTGGSSGIGLAIAHVFSRAGCAVVVVARDAARLERAKATFAATADVTTLALDITTPDAAEVIDQTLGRQGLYLDTLVNAAGIGLAGPFTDHDSSAVEALIALNITALTRLTRHALPAMRARGRGGVLNVGSLGGYVPGPNQAAYYASKAYVCSLTEALGRELSGSGVRMAVLAPGPVQTGFHAAMGTDTAFYRWLLPPVSPERAAQVAYVGYMLGRTVVVPGLFAKGLAVAVCVIPHWLTLPLIGVLLAPRK